MLRIESEEVGLVGFDGPTQTVQEHGELVSLGRLKHTPTATHPGGTSGSEEGFPNSKPDPLGLLLESSDAQEGPGSSRQITGGH